MRTSLSRALAALLFFSVAGCASGPSSVRTDVHCVEQKHVPIVHNGKVYMVPGGCTAWTVGPTPRERKAIDQFNGIENDHW